MNSKRIMRKVQPALRMTSRLFTLRTPPRLRLLYAALISVLLYVLYYFGIFTHLLEKDYFTQFEYPLNEDITVYIDQLRNGDLSDRPPINVYNYSFVTDAHSKCLTGGTFAELRLVYLVKSSMDHFERRQAIRQSWGFEGRFSDVPIRTIFLLGTRPSEPDSQVRVDKENKQFGDIVQADFLDAYYNNTIKTMMGYKWARRFCPKAKFYFFSDDDMYVSTKNVLRFLRHPTRYPQYLEDPAGMEVKPARKLEQVLDFELPDEVQLYAGELRHVAPFRHQSSKWYVSLEEYPFHLWPPYITAGAYVVSRATLDTLFLGSLFTKHFRFDDIYLALVAKKSGVEPYHCRDFRLNRLWYDGAIDYRYLIASHDFSDPEELKRFWEIQREAGNA
ncbi:beta-1,3-galactosyltransferase brn [Neocloeon triangulifer]|uniref:beta-1,3-galactosyltransferase brn n=1 Tax=Neocloeon triangulifer TaxID=2078957 RepID=UPI00286F17E5|nr:beta-1,3-galactosyltransferase brn [Neocloeon triangulifer]XP_059484856.1 beta-1,3-galactosyltransferase brn [Neocloeon triangulifer]XP_059484857.1 beta-1,3-galactosyltransferase brn [Neocloeon triangulifer]XP_059484858.1 beta-1,3-galactosyltransferase brn [Neocloeon triangulifer]XP_059484859.1 beta-1,3-galactosyltransferase brn [Neocloeon triangulifer]XP_059484861.1 beta-1,3-galactosyltransferase brn [Neocloeon triangulifer]XP_059484862.1 beta-1,3-galactosyltransferase brn [Neocloeon tria